MTRPTRPTDLAAVWVHSQPESLAGITATTPWVLTADGSATDAVTVVLRQLDADGPTLLLPRPADMHGLRLPATDDADTVTRLRYLLAALQRVTMRRVRLVIVAPEAGPSTNAAIQFTWRRVRTDAGVVLGVIDEDLHGSRATAQEGLDVLAAPANTRAGEKLANLLRSNSPSLDKLRQCLNAREGALVQAGIPNSTTALTQLKAWVEKNPMMQQVGVTVHGTAEAADDAATVSGLSPPTLPQEWTGLAALQRREGDEEEESTSGGGVMQQTGAAVGGVVRGFWGWLSGQGAAQAWSAAGGTAGAFPNPDAWERVVTASRAPAGTVAADALPVAVGTAAGNDGNKSRLRLIGPGARAMWMLLGADRTARLATSSLASALPKTAGSGEIMQAVPVHVQNDSIVSTADATNPANPTDDDAALIGFDIHSTELVNALVAPLEGQLLHDVVIAALQIRMVGLQVDVLGGTDAAAGSKV